MIKARNKEEFYFAKKTISKYFDHHPCSACWRVKHGGLAVSRAMGHIESKIREKQVPTEIVTAEPDVKVLDIQPEMDFVVLGTQGLFDFVPPEKVVELAASSIRKWKEQEEGTGESLQETLSEITKDIIQEAVLHGSEENITVLIILLPSALSRQ